MMYLLSVGANLILKHFAIKRANEMIKEDDNKMKSNDVIFNVLAFVPIVNTILAGIFGIALIVNNETFDTIVKIPEVHYLLSPIISVIPLQSILA